MACEVCYSQQLVLAASYTLTAGLSPNSNYYIWIYKENANVQTQQITTDNSGNITITSAYFPTGFFNQYGGIYFVEVSTDANGDEIVDITIAGSAYQCYNLNFVGTSCESGGSAPCATRYVVNSSDSINVTASMFDNLTVWGLTANCNVYLPEGASMTCSSTITFKLFGKALFVPYDEDDTMDGQNMGNGMYILRPNYTPYANYLKPVQIVSFMWGGDGWIITNNS